MFRRRPIRAPAPPAGQAAATHGLSLAPPSGRGPRGRLGAPRRWAARFASAREGVTAVEFGLIAMPFLCLMAAIVETALAFFAGQILDNAVSNAARQLYTGQFQAARPANASAKETLATFGEAICKSRVTLFDCRSVKIDVLNMTGKTNYTPSSPIDATSRTWREKPTKFGEQYENPGSNDIVLVQAAVEFPVFFSFLNPGTLANGKRVLQSTVAFRTEPYQ